MPITNGCLAQRPTCLYMKPGQRHIPKSSRNSTISSITGCLNCRRVSTTTHQVNNYIVNCCFVYYGYFPNFIAVAGLTDTITYQIAIVMTLPTRLFDCLDRTSIADMLVAKENGQWKTYSTAEVKGIVDRFSAGLLKLGINGGDM